MNIKRVRDNFSKMKNFGMINFDAVDTKVRDPISRQLVVVITAMRIREVKDFNKFKLVNLEAIDNERLGRNDKEVRLTGRST